MRLAAAVLAALSLSATPPPPSAARPTDLVDASGAVVSSMRLWERARTARVILVGESHRSRCDHAAQRRILEFLAASGLEPVLGLEMVPVDEALVLEKFNEGRLTPAQLDRALRWDANWGHTFSLYEPLFETAQRLGLPVIGLNVPPMAAFLVARHGILPEDLRPRAVVPEQTIPPSPRQLAELREVFEAHRAFTRVDDPDFERFARVQAMWDSKMAEEALRATLERGRPVVVLAGAGHVEPLGIPYRLQILAPGLPLLSIQPWRGGAPPPAGEADFHYFCPP